MENQQISSPQEQSHTIIIVVNKPKSPGTAFVLAVLFGPAGLLYVSIAGGIMMSVAAFVSFVLLPGISLFLLWIGCIIWAVAASENAGRKIARITINRDTGRQSE